METTCLDVASVVNWSFKYKQNGSDLCSHPLSLYKTVNWSVNEKNTQIGSFYAKIFLTIRRLIVLMITVEKIS